MKRQHLVENCRHKPRLQETARFILFEKKFGQNPEKTKCKHSEKNTDKLKNTTLPKRPYFQSKKQSRQIQEIWRQTTRNK